MSVRILQVALDTPLRRTFDYAQPADEPSPMPGARVRVPFGRRKLIGVLIAASDRTQIPASKLKRALEVLDEKPMFDRVTFELLCWAADYYHHPIGEVFAAAMPAPVRAGTHAQARNQRFRITAAGREHRASARRASKLTALLAWLANTEPATAAELGAQGFDARVRRAAIQNGWLEPLDFAANALRAIPSGLTATAEQRTAIDRIIHALGGFGAFLLFGVTGSGKTEVYLQVIAAVVGRGDQALVLVPEIALTPQLVKRFEQRFGAGIAVIHSQLTPAERRDAWHSAAAGRARIVIGTRSAVFTPLPALGLIVVDEEHDNSFKQQEGFHYSARDLAVTRAQRAGVPVVLGSATPSLESLENAASARYTMLRLSSRVQAASDLRMNVVDLRQVASEQSISQPALAAMSTHLAGGGQVIVFLNRRGFAPALFCRVCAWNAQCPHCDARMTVHRRAGQLRCHHCGARDPIPARCPQCHQPLIAAGQGTERIEETLIRLFPQFPIARLDRDSAAQRGAMDDVLQSMHAGGARILVGTQMLTKGHHFEDVSLVVVLDADQGLFASDYRATERLAQTITQVAGRAGRAARAGEVLIQTAFPHHPLLEQLIQGGYEALAMNALHERREAEWPPFSRLALLRADGPQAPAVDAFLRQALALSLPLRSKHVKVLGPAVALIPRRADRHRAHLLIQASHRAPLQKFLSQWIACIDALRKPRHLRWSIDVDPTEID